MHASANWNCLLPDQHPPTLTYSSAATKVHRSVDEGGVGPVPSLTPNEWEMESIRRYRALKDTPASNLSQQKYLSSSAIHGAILRLILHSKLLPITDWCRCAQIVASWFHSPADAPLGLLSYAVTQLVASHRLTPVGAARWLLEVGKAMLTAGNASKPKGVVSLEDWDMVEELERSVYAMQVMQLSHFGSFSCVLLETAINEMLTGTDARESWVLLPLCFLVKRNKDFALSAWNSDGLRHGIRMQRVCELGLELPPHISIILTTLM